MLGSVCISQCIRLGWAGVGRVGTYMGDKSSSGDQPRQRKAIANLLDCHASRPQDRRRDVRPAIVVHDDANSDINSRNACLTDKHSLSIVPRLAHLRHNREESRCTCIGERECRNCLDGRCERWVVDDFVVRDPDECFLPRGRSGRTVLDADGDGDDEDCFVSVAWVVELR